MNPTDKYPEVRDIADAICDKTASNEQVQHLEQLLTGDEEAQRFYYDYVSMHVHLKSAADTNLEFVYRRMTEEFIVRSKEPSTEKNMEHASSFNFSQGQSIEALPDNSNAGNPLWLKILIASLIILGVFLLVATWSEKEQTSDNFVAEILSGHISIVELGHIQGRYLNSGEYIATQATSLLLENGSRLQFEPQSKFKLFNQNEIALAGGRLFIQPADSDSSADNNRVSSNLIVHGPTFILYTNGDPLSLDLNQQQPLVSTGQNTLLLPNRWRPNHYWSFNSQADFANDSAGQAHGKPAKGVTRTKGLLGQGAFLFDNSADARINVGSGGGTAAATGSFAVTDGVTIEAIIQPKYSGELNEIDEIFRKDMEENKDFRMLLSFQNDLGKQNLRPTGEYQESLSFGLYLVGQGYHELKLPLDGLNGRPTLARLKEGRTHHVVATYDVVTGLKAIYIDGEKLASYQYPAGSKMLSGGTGLASIGNIPNPSRWDLEAFSGVIDEVAFYNFSLPPFMIKRHVKQVQQGYNYFGLRPSDAILPEKIKIPLPKSANIRLDPLTGLPVKVFYTNPY